MVFLRYILACVLCLSAGTVVAERVTVAVAANFLPTAEKLVAAFEAEAEGEILLAHGSTGALTAQIERGAPYDLFFAADQARPARLVAGGRTLGGARTYAVGLMALVFRGAPVTLPDVGTLAIADPDVAPYGAAAQEVMRARGAAPRRLVRGENVAQALTFVVTGGADAGLVARAQVLSEAFALLWEPVDPALHAPVLQDAVILKRAQENETALAFFAFAFSQRGQAIVQSSGYGAVP